VYIRFGKSRFNSRRVRKANVLDAVVNFIPYYNEIRLKKDLGWLSPVWSIGRRTAGNLVCTNR